KSQGHTEHGTGELPCDVAHELRPRISTVDSFLEGIEDGVIPANSHTWRTLRDQTSRLRRLVDDIDAVSRADERQLNLRPRPLPADAAVDEAIRAAEAAFVSKEVALKH